MRGIVLVDHLDAGAAVFADLVNVRPFHKAEADVGVAKGIIIAGHGRVMPAEEMDLATVPCIVLRHLTPALLGKAIGKLSLARAAQGHDRGYPRSRSGPAPVRSGGISDNFRPAERSYLSHCSARRSC
jgi:hypothetical protein